MKRGSAHRAIRREDAEERRKERQKRTPQEQLTLLDSKLGEGQGAVKERQRLTKMIVTKGTQEDSHVSKKIEKPKTRSGRRAERMKRKNK